MKEQISYKEYKKALLTVDLFHAQIDEKYNSINDKKNKTNLKDWIFKTDMKTRLRSVLYYLSTDTVYRYQGEQESNPAEFKYLEDIDKSSFLKCRNAGLKTWNHFKEVRGY